MKLIFFDIYLIVIFFLLNIKYFFGRGLGYEGRVLMENCGMF